MSRDTDRTARLALEHHSQNQATQAATCCARPELELMAVRDDGTRSFECRGCGVRRFPAEVSDDVLPLRRAG